MPKLREIYGGNYLKADDIKDLGDVNVVIENVTVDELEDGKKKAVLHFRGKEKTLVVNVTNANMLEELTGSDDTDDWIGKRICIYTCKVDFQGKRVLAIRVKAGTGGKPPAPKPEPAAVLETELEDPPF